MKLIFVLFSLLISCPVLAQSGKQCISVREMDELFERISNRRIEVSQQSTSLSSAIGPHSFIWPLRPAANNYQPSYYYIGNYVDVDYRYSVVRDYHCGNRSYNTRDPETLSVYNHSGIDIVTGPFPWLMLDNNSVEVIAAEGGEIVEKHQGEASRTCETGGQAATYYGNYIAIKHSDSSIAFYMHMKGGTLTSKTIGQTVTVGEKLGVVGSSGNSSAPHLHFEVRSEFGVIIDPFQNGNCKDDYIGYITNSLWAAEEPYHNKRILSVFTMSNNWSPASCDTIGASYGTSETVNYRNHFSEGNTIFFTAAVRDIHDGNTVRLRIFNPAGTEIFDNTYTAPSSDSFETMRIIPTKAIIAPSVVGTYRLHCSYDGKTEVHLFTVGCPGALTLSGARGSSSGAISGSSINSTETLASSVVNVEYQAETEIKLNPGFIATAGSEFLSRINACTIGGQLTSNRQGVTEKK